MNTANNNAASGAVQTQAIRMLANFSKNYFVPLLDGLDNPDKLYERCKADDCGLSSHSVSLLLEGKEPLIRGFEVVDVPNKHVVPQVQKKPEGAERVRIWAGYQPAGELKAVRPGSKIAMGLEQLKDGTTLSALRALLEHDSDDATRSFLAYRPKKRGYGIRFDAETQEFFLIFPEGKKDIFYKGKPATGAEKDEE